jgi:hypothetical protein
MHACCPHTQTDAFTLEGPHVASPATLRVTLTRARNNPNWQLDHIVCTLLDGCGAGTAGGCGSSSSSSSSTSGGRRLYFAADRWFETGAGTTSALLHASTQPPAMAAPSLVPHTVRVHTSALRGAGTDSTVCINVIGAAGSSGWQELPAQQGCFAQGQVDTFTALLPLVGPLTHLGIRSDGTGGQHPAWHVDRVCISVLDPAASGGHSSGSGNAPLLESGSAAAGVDPTQQPVWFYGQRWLSASHGLELLLPARPADPLDSCCDYTVHAYTSDAR